MAEMKEHDLNVKYSTETEELIEKLIENVLRDNGQSPTEANVKGAREAVMGALPLLASCAPMSTKGRPVK